MGRDRDAQELLELGDKLRQRGEYKKAAAAYVRCADAWLAETILDKARDLVVSDPVAALKALAHVERLVGPSWEGRELSAQAYERLGQPEIARRFLVPVPIH